MTWSTSRTDDAAVLTVQPLRRLSPSERSSIEAEVHRLLAFTNPGATQRHVRTPAFVDERGGPA